jgi:hypothetical protein
MTKHAEGGRIGPYPESGHNDNIPCVIHPGEARISRRVVEYYGRDLLEKMFPNTEIVEEDDD